MPVEIQTEGEKAPVSTASSDAFDIVIVGGAMTGATLALALATLPTSAPLTKPLKIALIESFRPDNCHPGFDARAIALAHGSIQTLTRLGIWQHLAHLGCDINQIHVSDQGNLGMTQLKDDDFSVPYLGKVVELEAVGKVLFEQLEQSDVRLYCPARLERIVASPQHQMLTLSDGSRLSAKLVIAADGSQSQVRQAFQLPQEQVDFGQFALIANIQTSQPHQGWAYERFTRSGPLALLPMQLSAQSGEYHTNGSHPRKRAATDSADVKQAKGQVSLVWALDELEAKRLQSAPQARFLAELQQAFGYRAGQFIKLSERHCYPLIMTSMPRPIYHRCLFIGNAAQTLHPIAGQGFNLGLRDIEGVVAAVQMGLSQHLDIGSATVTHHYLSERQADRDCTITAIESLVRGFSNDYWPLKLGRNLALRLLSWFPPLKVPVAHKAMGWNV